MPSAIDQPVLPAPGYLRVGYLDLTGFYTVFGSNFDGYPAVMSYYWQGSIDEASLHNRALTAGQVAALYASGAAHGAPLPPEQADPGPPPPPPPASNLPNLVQADGPSLYWRLGEVAQLPRRRRIRQQPDRHVPQRRQLRRARRARRRVHRCALRLVRRRLQQPAGDQPADVLARGVAQDRLGQWRQDPRARERPDRVRHHLRPPALHDEQRSHRVRHPGRRHAARHHVDHAVQRRRVPPHRRDPGRERHGALRRRRAGRHQPDRRARRRERLLAPRRRQPHRLAERSRPPAPSSVRSTRWRSTRRRSRPRGSPPTRTRARWRPQDRRPRPRLRRLRRLRQPACVVATCSMASAGCIHSPRTPRGTRLRSHPLRRVVRTGRAGTSHAGSATDRTPNRASSSTGSADSIRSPPVPRHERYRTVAPTGSAGTSRAVSRSCRTARADSSSTASAGSTGSPSVPGRTVLRQ